MLFKPSVSNDISKYFKGTFVKFRELGDKLLYVSRVSPDEIQCTDEDGELFVVELREDEPYEMDYTLPHRGLFLLDGRLCHLCRIPARQWRRGICSDNTLITSISTGKNLALGFKELRAYVEKPVYQHLSSFSGRAMLLGQRFGVTGEGVIYCDRLRIGAYSGGVAKVSSLFVEEIKKVAGSCEVCE